MSETLYAKEHAAAVAQGLGTEALERAIDAADVVAVSPGVSRRARAYAVEIEQFVTLLVRSGLSSNHEAQELLASFRKECATRNSPTTSEAFCDFLIATNLFTAYQCEKLRAGKWKGYYLDNYLLLEQIGKDHEFSYYRARDARDGTLVRLTVTPMARAQGPDIEYRVDRINT